MINDFRAYFWIDGQVVSYPRTSITYMYQGMEHLVNRMCYDPEFDGESEDRYTWGVWRVYQAALVDWFHIPKADMPKEFLMGLLLIGAFDGR